MQVKFCKICKSKHYGRGLCRTHWKRQYAFNTVLRKFGHRHKCKISSCLNNTSKDYCYEHLIRIKHNLPLDLSVDGRSIRMKGKNNPRWNGGVSEYPNHYLMKKNRLIILMHNPKCELCKINDATEVHHKDRIKSNHNLDNLMAICDNCHQHIHHLKNNNALALSRGNY